MENAKKIDVAADYTPYLGGRYHVDGPGNGEDFRKKFLEPVLKSGGVATVILDGARGYPSSFLEEAFGGLVRLGYPADHIKNAFKFVARDPGYGRFVPMIHAHIDRASSRSTSEVRQPATPRQVK